MLRSKTEIIGDVAIFVSLIILNIIVLYPFYYTFINSINVDLVYGPALVWPSEISFYNYETLLANPLIPPSLLISIIRTVVGMIVTVFLCSMTAFVLRKHNIMFRKLYLIFLLIPMFFGGGLIPRYLNYRNLQLLNTFWVFIFPRAVKFFYVVILINAFQAVSNSLEESAVMDGAGYFTIFTRIYFPLAMPIVAAIALFEGVGQWNAWFDSAYFTRSPRLMTLQAYLMRIIKESELQYYTFDMDKDMGDRDVQGMKLSVIMITVVPITIIYPLLQRFFISGIMVGSLKE